MEEWSYSNQRPIINYLREVMPRVFPILKNRPGRHKSGVGGYHYRTLRHDTTKLSTHAKGLAADIYLDWHAPYEKRIGNALYAMFISNADKLGVKNVIWNKKIWTASNNKEKSYKGGSHRDHVHVEFSQEGSLQKPIVLEDLCNFTRSNGVNHSNDLMTKKQLRRSVEATGDFVAMAPPIDILTPEEQLARSKVAVGNVSKQSP